jgi:Bacterial protein of unknown function (DUF894).
MSAAALAATALLGFVLRIPAVADEDLEPVRLQDPEVTLDLTNRSGPIVIEIEYAIAAADARNFYGAMQRLRAIRHRNGAFDWSISRDINHAEKWVERFHCPTWADYLRQRGRNTPEEMRVQDEARAYIKEGHELVIRRLLERPFGSVRWKENAPDF